MIMVQDNRISWWCYQRDKIKALLEIVLTLILSALLIISVWGIRNIIIWIIGITPNSIKDRTLYWIVRFSEFGTIIIIAFYIICDIFRHILKAYADIKEIFRKSITKEIKKK